MFKFAFSSENAEDDTNEHDKIEKNIKWIESHEIKAEEIEVNESLKVNSIKCGDYIIKYVSNDEIVDSLKNSCDSNNLILNADQSHSDLISGVYEGGLKVWECTYDLLNFIKDSNLELRHKNVLDLGCGAGIIGIFSCLKGANTVFQDYNIEVIKQMTIPNIKLNNIKADKCTFYCGDWKSFLDLFKQAFREEKKFDYIFTSETIYNTENYRKVLDIFAQLLKRNGTIYLAAKYYYFGVGGGIRQFEDMLKTEDFVSSTCWICSEGVKRAILKINFKQSF